MWNKWVIRDFSRGLVDKVDDNLLPDNAAKDVQNFIARKIGSLVKRPGQARLNGIVLSGPIQGLHAYYHGVTRDLIAASAGRLYRWDSVSKSFSEIHGGFDNSRPILFATCVNYMVAADGAHQPVKWDGNTVTTLQNAPNDSYLPTYHVEKLFVVPQSQPSVVRFSESFKPEEWPEVYMWPVRDGDGDIITALAPFGGELVIFKTYSMSVLHGVSMDDMRLYEMENRIGCVGPRAWVDADGKLYFISREGIFAWNGASLTNLTADVIPNLWKNINQEHIHKACAGKYEGLLWFALPEGQSSYNNLVLIRDSQGAWWPWRGIDASCFLQFNDGAALHFYSGNSMQGYVMEQCVGDSDNGQPIGAYWIGKTFDLGDAEHVKVFNRAFLLDSPNSGDVDLQLAMDYGDFTSMTPVSNQDLMREYRFTSMYRARYLQPKLVHNVDGTCEVRGLAVEYRARRQAG